MTFRIWRAWGFLIFLAILLSAGWSETKTHNETLTIADMTAPPPTLDPFKTYGTQSQSLFRQLYDNLVDRDENGRLIPAIAEKWTYKGNGKWHLKIRRGVYFHDGSLLSSSDVKFSLEKIISPSSVKTRRRDFSFIIRVETAGKYAVDVYTRGPAPTLPARLAQFSMIIPEQKHQKMGDAAFFKIPVGAGPFRLISIDQNKAVLSRHDRYYRDSSKIKTVVFHFSKDFRQRLKMMKEGKIDLITNVLPGYTRQIARDPSIAIVKKQSLQFNYANFDTLSPGPLQDRRVRQALAFWTNVPSLIRYVAHGNGSRIPTPVMPEDFGFNPELKPYSFSPKVAKKLLREAGYPKGFELSAVSSGEMESLAKAVAKQWRRLGVILNIRVTTRSEAIRLWARTRDYKVFFFSPTNPLQDASFHLRILLDKNHPINRFHDSEAMQLIKKVDQTGNQEERIQLLRRLQEIVYREVPVIALYQRIKIYAVSGRVNGFSGFPDTILRLYNITLPSDGAPGLNRTNK